jgi:hypothetical protein
VLVANLLMKAAHNNLYHIHLFKTLTNMTKKIVLGLITAAFISFAGVQVAAFASTDNIVVAANEDSKDDDKKKKKKAEKKQEDKSCTTETKKSCCSAAKKSSCSTTVVQ